MLRTYITAARILSAGRTCRSNGADLIAAIKGEINTLNNEAKKHRTAGEQSAIKLKSILEAVSVRRRIKITRPNERE